MGNNIDKICSIINHIIYNIQIPESEHDIFSYFLYGHCNVFIEILDNIFKDDIEFYISDEFCHVIGKIDGFFYDARGFLPNIEYDKYEKIDKERFYYLVNIKAFGNYNSTCDKKVMEDGIKLGLEKYNDVFKIRKLKKQKEE
ncbi:MAG: hypothetical protein E7158_06595 [Firmicutes bacterium]|nr:hypothetical protein [Bacillota bacterium]